MMEAPQHRLLPRMAARRDRYLVFILIALADWKNVSWAGEHPFFIGFLIRQQLKILTVNELFIIKH